MVRELTGHGIGKEMHEDPSIPNYGARGNGVMLKEGMCIAIEPMITMGDRRIGLLPDNGASLRLTVNPQLILNTLLLSVKVRQRFYLHLMI